MQNNTAFLSLQELEQRVVAPFVQQNFPFVPQNTRARVALVRPQQTALQRWAGERPCSLPAQYSYTYTCCRKECAHVVYVLANARGDILRVLMSK